VDESASTTAEAVEVAPSSSSEAPLPTETGAATTTTEESPEPVELCTQTSLGERCWLQLDPLWDGPAPLVVDIHAWTVEPITQFRGSGMDIVAGEAGAIVVYPDSPDRSWNAGNCCNPARDEGRDDVLAIVEIVDRVIEQGNVDSSRVYLTGFSNGCGLAQGVLDRFGDRFAAGACMGDFLTLEPVADPVPVPFLQLHGTDDTLVPYEGGVFEGYVEPGAVANFETWAARNRCSGQTLEEVAGERTRVEAEGCDAPVVHVRVDGEGHRPRFLFEDGSSSTELMWEFLSQFSL
jgi:polyhydroxybutyrate depolymerase